MYELSLMSRSSHIMQYTNSKRKNQWRTLWKKKHLKHKNPVQELANPPFQSILGWMKKLSNTSKHIDLAPKKQKNLTTSWGITLYNRDFAVKKYPELKEKIIAITTNRYILIVMKTGTHSFKRYKDLINVTVLSKTISESMLITMHIFCYVGSHYDKIWVHISKMSSW